MPAVAGVPAPLRLLPQPVDAGAKLVLQRLVAVEILPRAEEPCEQVRGLDDVAAIVLAGEPDRPAGLAVQEVRQDAVIAVRPEQKADHAQQAVAGIVPTDPAARGGDHDRHGAEARAAGRDGLEAIIGPDVAALAGEAAHRVREIPEVAERLPLHEIEQGVVAEVARARLRRERRCLAHASISLTSPGPSTRSCPQLWPRSLRA